MNKFVLLLAALVSLRAQTSPSRSSIHQFLGKDPRQWERSASNAQFTPSTAYSTFLGGNANDYASAVTTDHDGNIYITGWTFSNDFPVTPGSLKTAYTDPSPKTADIFVAKFNPDGNLIYCTYLGGTKDDKANAIAADSAGNAYIIGTTTSLDFPTTRGAIVSSIADDYSTGVFVLKLNPTGDALIYSTLLGDGYYNGGAGNAIAVDAAGNAVVAGTDYSDQFSTTPGAANPNSPAGNFVAKLNATGTGFLFVTASTGPNDTASALTLDAAGDVYITGSTRDLTPRARGVVQPVNGAQTFYRTTDGGAHWSLPGTGLPITMVVTNAAIDPHDSSLIYVSGQAGLFRSTDSGDTWTALFAAKPVGKIIIDPGDSRHLVMFANGANGFPTNQYVSRDGGTNWTLHGQVSGVSADFVMDIVFDSSRPQYAYAYGTSTNLFYSRDGGDTWNQAQTYNNFRITARGWAPPVVDPFNPNILYTSAYTQGSGVYKSTDSGMNWTWISDHSFTTLIADPLHKGGIYGMSTNGYLEVSSDGGATWTPHIQQTFVNRLALDPVDQSTLYIYHYYDGVYRSTDGGVTTQQFDNLPPNSNVTALYLDPNTSGKWLALTALWSDAFITHLSADGTTTVFSTFLGGTGDDAGSGIAVDSEGNVYVAGSTNSADFNGAQDSHGRPNRMFVARLSNDGSQLTQNALISAYGELPRIALDQSGGILLAGTTIAANFPVTPDALQQSPPPFDPFASSTVGFYLKLSPAGDITSASYIGGTEGYSSATGVAIAPSGRVCIVGNTAAPDLPTTPNAAQSSLKNLTDAFLTTIDFRPW